MEVIQIKTLVDITNSNVRRINQGTQLELDQFRNWTTLLQCIGMRAIIEYDYPPKVEQIKVDGLGFGTKYKGLHNVWTFTFRPDRENAFAKDDNNISLLLEDLDLVPVIINLTETINIQQAVFSLNDTRYTNTVVKAI